MNSQDRTDWGAVVVALTAGIVAAIHFGKMPPALPEIRSQIPISLIVAGWVMSIFSATGMTLGIVTGTLADRVGARKLSLVGLATLAVGSLLGAYSDSGAALLASRFVEGFGFIAVAVSSPILIVRASAKRDLQLTLGIWTTYMPAGMALAMVFTPVLLESMGWRQFWVAAAILALVWLVLVLWKEHVPESGEMPKKPEHGLWENVSLTLRAPGPWLLSLAFAFYTIQWISLMAWLPSFLVEERGLSMTVTGLLTAVVVAANIPGNLIVGWLFKLGVSRSNALIISALGLSFTAWGLFNESLSDTVRFVLCIGFSFFGGMTPGAALSGAPVVAPTRGQIGTVNGMMVQGSHVGQLLGPPALAAVATLTGDWGNTVWVLWGGSVGIVLMALLYRKLID